MGKQYAILRVQKCKGAEIGAMQYHNDREPGKHTNPDIDQSRTRMNRELCPHADYEGEVRARIDAGYKGTRKVRKDAVRLVEGIVTASPGFFRASAMAAAAKSSRKSVFPFRETWFPSPSFSM